MTSSSGFTHAFANLLKTMIGSGLLTLPWVTAQAGMGFSLVGLTALAVLTQAAIRLMVRCVVHERQLAGAVYVDLDRAPAAAATSEDHGSGSWQLVSTAACGKIGWYITCTSLMTAQLGVVSSYLDFVGGTLVDFAGCTAMTSRVLLWFLVTAMCMLRVLKSVSLLSMAALFVYAYIICLVVYFGAEAYPERASTEPLIWFNPSRIGAWFGPSLFAFEGMGTALSIYESMGAVDARPFFTVISAAYAVAILVYCGVAAIGYAAWGQGVESVVLHSFPSTPIGQSANLMLAVVLLLSCALQLTPVFQTIEGALPQGWPSNLWPIFRGIIVALCATASYLIPDMEAMVGLTGALAFSSIGFILPGLFFLRLRPPAVVSAESKFGSSGVSGAGTVALEAALAYIMVALGLVGGVWGVYTELSKCFGGE